MTWWIVVVLIACGGDAPKPQEENAPAATAVPEPAPVDAGKVALDAADAAAKTLGKTLKEKVAAAMADGGPKNAVSVCADSAMGLTAQVTGETQAAVGRSSLRLRNPNNAGPAWVSTWLTEQGEKKANEATGFSRVEQDGDRQVARVIKPIPVEAVCVTCHGPVDQIPADVKAVLAERYPNDAAVGYAEGDLRGALWAEVVVKK